MKPLAAVALLLASAAVPAADPKPPTPKLPTGKELMAAKVKAAEGLLAALAVDDFKKVEAAATELGQISRAGEFVTAYRTDEYAVQAKLFQRAAATLAARARDKNADGAMLAYLDLSLSCVKCHRHTRNPADARLPGFERSLAGR